MAFQRWWIQELHAEGLAVPHWPSEYGGADISLSGQILLADELARAAAPKLDLFINALNHLPGTLLPFGTEEQKRRYLPAIPKGSAWCQGFSEPQAGSDLASLRCKAERDGDDYVINGQKIWSSVSRFADHCIMLVRTDPDAPKHAGISFLLMDMNLPGIEVRPIEQIDGHAEFGELFLTDVRVPVSNRVGPENEGWKVAQATLASERGVLAFDYSERRRYKLENYYREALQNGADWLDDPEALRTFMSILAEVQAGRRMILQLLRDNEQQGSHAKNTALASAYIKLLQTTLSQRVGDFVSRYGGLDGQALGKTRTDSRFLGLYDFLHSFSQTIAGGTNEIMRNIIAERDLGLPRN